MASRSKDRATEAIAEVFMPSRKLLSTNGRPLTLLCQLKETTGKEAIFLQLDLANLDSVTRAANEFKR